MLISRLLSPLTRSLMFALMLALALSSGVHAAPVKLEPVPVIPPPPGMVQDPSLEPQITILQRGHDRVEEFRVRGKLYMLKVTPPHGTPYYLLDPTGNGQFLRMNEITPNLLVPLWVLFSF